MPLHRRHIYHSSIIRLLGAIVSHGGCTYCTENGVQMAVAPAGLADEEVDRNEGCFSPEASTISDRGSMYLRLHGY